MSRSRPVCRPPSARSATRSRRSLRSRTWWTSARPSSHGAPTCLIEDSGDAPVPPAVAGQVDVRRAGLGDTGRDRAHASARDELDADPRPRVDRPQVGDELGEVLDRVDVVVRRRADVALAGLAATERGDVGGRLLAGQLAALARLRALGDLDLELVGAGEVRGGHAEPRRRDLLDPGVVAAAVGGRGVPGGILAALAGVRGAAGTLDADRQRLVGFGAQRADAHRRDDEAADDVAGGLDLRERDGRRGGADAQLVARDRAVRRRAGERGPIPGERGVGVARGVDLGAGSPWPDRTWISPAMRGEKRWTSPSARNRAKPGSGRRGSRPAAGSGMASAAARRRSWRSARSASVVRPGHAAAVGKQRATTDASRSTTSMSAPPMYEATALMPIRASVLRRPASNAATRPLTASSGVSGLGAARAGELGRELDGESRLDGGRTDREDHRHRVDVEDVDRADRDIGPTAQAGVGERRVDGTDREDRRDRQPVDRPARRR